MSGEPIVWVELRSSAALQRILKNKEYSLRDFTEMVNRSKAARKAKIRRGKSTIGNLISGHEKRVHPAIANAIAEVLDTDRGLLFTDRVSTYDIDTKHPRKAA